MSKIASVSLFLFIIGLSIGTIRVGETPKCSFDPYTQWDILKVVVAFSLPYALGHLYYMKGKDNE